MTENAVEVLKALPMTWLQDVGRPGYGAVGVGASGAADRGSYALANRLVGNDEGAAVIETVFGGLALRALGPIVLAVTGAPAPVTIEGRGAVNNNAPVYLSEGDVVTLGVPPTGLRSYVAVSGGFDDPPVLGSRSYDTMAKLGPAPLAAGRVLRIGPTTRPGSAVPIAPVREPTNETVEVAVVVGPRAEWLADLDALFTTEWTASSDSDRVGVRLNGTPLARADAWATAELASEGVVRGSIQVPGGGLPVVFLNDHPVTGGYPVAGVLTEAACDLLAQVRPGQRVRLRRTREFDL